MDVLQDTEWRIDWEQADRGPCVLVPFPVAPRRVVQESGLGGAVAAWEGADLEYLALSTLYATQDGVARSSVEYWLTRSDYQAPGWLSVDSVPLVFRWRGRNYIYDGHHRLTAMRLRGYRAALVLFIDCDRRVSPV